MLRRANWLNRVFAGGHEATALFSVRAVVWRYHASRGGSPPDSTLRSIKYASPLSLPPHAAYSCANVERDPSRITTTRRLRGSDGPGDEIEQRQKGDRDEARPRSVNVAIAETSLAGRKEALQHDHV
jgi:hypothetical protein